MTRHGSRNVKTSPEQLVAKMASYITHDHSVTPDETAKCFLSDYVYSMLAGSVMGIQDNAKATAAAEGVASRMMTLSREAGSFDKGDFLNALPNYFEAALTEAQELRTSRDGTTPLRS